MQISSKQLWLNIRDYIFIVGGIIAYAIGFTAFIFPEKVVIGGVPGMSTLIFFLSERWFGWGIPVAVSNYAINLILLAIAFRTVGRQFVLRTVFGATVLSFFIGILQPFFTEPLIPGQPFMNMVLGGVLCGLGIGMIFTHNGSSGGTDIVAAMVSKRSNVSVGRTILITDFCIIFSSYLVFHNLDTVVYGLIVLFCISYLTDFVINSNRQAVQFTIFSSRWREIANVVTIDLHRGCTVVNGLGWYTKSDVKVLLIVCRKFEAMTVLRIIQTIDPRAFVTMGNVNSVYGQGFDIIKGSPKPYDSPASHISADETEAKPISELAASVESESRHN